MTAKTEGPEPPRRPVEAPDADRGLVIVYTGGGKGKTTAALGMALRAVGRGMRVLMVQFIKGSWHYGELDSVKRLAPELQMLTSGKGFVGILDDKLPREEHAKAARETLRQAHEAIHSGNYDLVILDEINYAVQLKLLAPEEVIALARDKPRQLDLVFTGNHAPRGLIDIADLVTEMREIKHPFRKGIPARVGIDY